MSVSVTRHLSTALIVVATASACSVFKFSPPKPTTAPAPTTRPTTPTTQPTTPATQPTTQPANRPANQPANPPATTPTQGAPTQGTPTRPPTTPTTTPATTPATTAPAAAAPAAPRLTQDQIEQQRITADSTRLANVGRPRRYSPVYFTLMLDIHTALMRTATGGVLAPEDEPTFNSFELGLQKANGGGLGIAVRGISSIEEYEYSELAILMGSRKFALDLGAASRTGWDSIGVAGGGDYDTTFVFGRAGFRSRANLGATDFSVQLRTLYYIGLPALDDALPDAKLEGWSMETGLSWTWSKFPFTANLGYRIERFKVFSRETETTSLILGGGLMFGRRNRPPAPAAAPAPAAPATQQRPPANSNAQGRP